MPKIVRVFSKRRTTRGRWLAVAAVWVSIVVPTALHAQPNHREVFRAQAEERAARRAERVQQRSMARDARQREQSMQPRAPQRDAFQPAPPMPETPNQPGRPGRMTPDERRALRQQIDEAGRDVYRPRRP